MLADAATITVHALAIEEERKLTIHSNPCHSIKISFVPLVMESLGGWSEEAINTICSFGWLLSHRSDTTTGKSTQHLFQRLAITLWKGNANLWISRLPVLPPEVDGLV